METYEGILWTVTLTSTGVFVIRFLLSFVGFGIDMDVDGGDGDSGHGGGDLQVISLYTVVAFLMVGGWVAIGMQAHTTEMQPGMRMLVGTAAGIVTGFGAMYVIALTMFKLRKLEADGTLRDFDAKGMRGEVYVRVPPAGEGEGQVRLEVRGVMKVFRAVNEDDTAIDSFKPVQITGVSKDHVLRVRHTG